MKNTDIALMAAFVLSAVSAMGILSSLHGDITGAAITTSVTNVDVAAYIALSMSDNLSGGIDFGIIDMPADDINATYNYNGTSNKAWTNETLYWISVSGDTSQDVDFCIMATEFANEGGDTIDLNNYTWSDSTANSMSLPSGFPGLYAMGPAFTKGSTNVAPGSDNYYRFWLGVDLEQPPGVYNNTVVFKAVAAGQQC